MPQHKWHKEIKAWADGATLQYRYLKNHKEPYSWSDWMEYSSSLPFYEVHPYEYRIKPEPRVFWFLEGRLGQLVQALSEKIADESLSTYGGVWVKKHKYVEPME